MHSNQEVILHGRVRGRCIGTLKISLAGIMILYLLVMAQRPSPLGTNVETSEMESVTIVVPVFFK